MLAAPSLHDAWMCMAIETTPGSRPLHTPPAEDVETAPATG